MPIYENLTVAEAIQEGLQVLGITKDQAVIEVLDEGKKGFLGLGKKQARVSIEKRIVEEPAPVEEVPAKPLVEPDPVTTEDASSVMEAAASEPVLLTDLTNISKALNAPALVKTARQDGVIIFQLETQKQGILIGKHGKTLNALQYLAQVYIHRIAKNKLSIVVNVGDYREKRQAILERLASRTAEKVKRTGRPVFLEPMPAFERKQIHSVLSKDAYVQTHSEGDEPYRYLVVEPADKRI